MLHCRTSCVSMPIFDLYIFDSIFLSNAHDFIENMHHMQLIMTNLHALHHLCHFCQVLAEIYELCIRHLAHDCMQMPCP